MNRLVYRAAQTIVTTLAIAATVWLIIQIRQGFLTMHSWTIMMEQCAHREIWCASNSFADAEWHIETVKPYMAFFAFGALCTTVMAFAPWLLYAQSERDSQPAEL
ncbi:MAG: hypothetical protein WAT17_00870 [Candidatus Saccharimonadales bacterium]|jgi:hypothetical protein